MLLSAYPAVVQDALRNHGTILTPTVRAARQLSRAYDVDQRRQEAGAWQPARILSWAVWTAGVWSSALVSGAASSVLLNPIQERFLWRRVLDRSDALGLQSHAAITGLCSTALRLLGAYDIHDTFSNARVTHAQDGGAFAAWYNDFASACRDDSLLPASHLDLELASLIRSGAVAPDRDYVLYGFLTHTPARHALIAALRQAGARVIEVTAQAEQTQAPILLRCDDPGTEVASCCRWIRSELEAGAEVTVVVPDLEDCRLDFERELRAVVAPWLLDVTASQAHAPYEFSVGRPIAQLPMISDALNLLRWFAGPVPFQEAGAVLRSPFLTLANTPERGAELEAWTLLDTHRVRTVAALTGELSLRECERIVRPESAHTADRLRDIARRAERAFEGRRSYAEFCDQVRPLLTAAGWPGAAQDSLEFQAVERWEAMLDRIASLDLFSNRVTFSEWLDEVMASAAETMFAAENTGAPVQIVTVAEAAGIHAERLWFLHAEEGTWPVRREAHPLLPRSLQRSLGMPGADTAADEAQDRSVLAGLLNSARTVRFSYAVHGPGGEVRPSSGVLALPGLKLCADTVTVQGSPAVELEELEDLLPVPKLPAHATGGVSILTSQAQCGFRAFAERRLQLRDAEIVEAGLSAAERGEQVHTVLQEFWKICKTHSELRRLGESRNSEQHSERDVLLRTCIDKVFARGSASHPWDTAYLQVQRERLFRLVSDWLDVELQRTPFEVSALEFEVPSAQIGPLQLKVRVDRIDTVPTDSGPATILIDYKTGAAERAGWFGERPDAPQLPAYAIAGGIADVRGIALARVRVGKLGMNFEEMLADRSLLGIGSSRKKTEPGFDERMTEWQRDLTALAEAFAHGDAQVDPKDYLTTCKGCASRLLCRVNVSRLEPDDDLLEETEDEGGA